MNRAQRRAKQKNTPRWMPKTKDERIKALVKNGITPDDMASEYRKGWDAGFAQATEPVVKTIYAAVCLALNDLHGFGRERCIRVLKRVDWHLFNSLSSMEAIDAVYDRMHLRLDFSDPFERVTEDDEK